MDIDLAHLPDDTQALKALVHALAGEIKAKSLKIAQLERRVVCWNRFGISKSAAI